MGAWGCHQDGCNDNLGLTDLCVWEELRGSSSNKTEDPCSEPVLPPSLLPALGEARQRCTVSQPRVPQEGTSLQWGVLVLCHFFAPHLSNVMRVPRLTGWSASFPGQPPPSAGHRAAQCWGEHLDFHGPCGEGLGLPFLNWEQELAGRVLLGWHATEPKGPSALESGCAGGFPALFLEVESI